MSSSHPLEAFWSAAAGVQSRAGVSRSTMMGYPCLRVHGAFFASTDPQTGALIAKLPAKRVEALIADGTGAPFAPAGRAFREWVHLDLDTVEDWPAYLEEAYAFVAGA